MAKTADAQPWPNVLRELSLAACLFCLYSKSRSTDILAQEMDHQCAAPKQPEPGSAGTEGWFRYLALASIVVGLLPYLLVVVLLLVVAAVRYFGFFGMDIFVTSVLIICVCPKLGLWLGIMGLIRYRSVVATPRERRLSVAGLVLNGFNGAVLFLFSLFAR